MNESINQSINQYSVFYQWFSTVESESIHSSIFSADALGSLFIEYGS